MKKNVLIVNSYYYPGYRSGGPQQTIMNIVDVFGDDYNFYILTLNHDYGIQETYININNGWNRVGKAKVKYVSDELFTGKTIVELSKEMDVIFCGGLFDKITVRAMMSKKLNKIDKPLIVAPMGVFSDGAVKQKFFKKKMFFVFGKMIGLFKNTIWSFTSEIEKKEFMKYLGQPQEYEIAMDIPRRYIDYSSKRNKRKKKNGELRVVFISRIHPKKNLIKAIDILKQVRGNIIFDIYGIKEDSIYWNKCEEMLLELPSNIKWEYKGEVESSKVIDMFLNYDVFLFPTLGENFGHVIYEALLSGCIPIISNTTPWNNIGIKGCGGVFSLDDDKGYVDLIHQYIDYSDEQLRSVSNKCLNYAKEVNKKIVDESGYKRLFEK